MLRFLFTLFLAAVVYSSCRPMLLSWLGRVETIAQGVVRTDPPASPMEPDRPSTVWSQPTEPVQPTVEERLRFIPSNNREVRAKQLADCARPGSQVHKIMSSGGSPLERLLQAYEKLRQRWTYRSDDIDGVPESFQMAEDSLGSLGWAGDCEDIGVVLMACAETISVPSRIAMHRGKSNDGPGHAYCEILIGDTYAQAEPLLRRLATEWKVPKLAYRQDTTGVWLAFDFAVPQEHFTEGPLAFFIYPDGAVKEPDTVGQSEHSDQRFFQIGNLTAIREKV